MSTHYDALVIGAGQAGGPLAQALAKAGRKTAIVESTHVGG
jgi:pyruvate/2-oxoglutarate dehydrogenase complex dihydrolipoamide dehydrogenase (E3) component